MSNSPLLGLDPQQPNNTDFLCSYLRALFNISAANSSVTSQDAQSLHDQIIFKNIGNHVPIESTFLYHLYSLVSEKDSLWLEDLYPTIFPDKSAQDLPIDEFIPGLLNYAKNIPGDPSQWTFGGLERSQDGTFPDAKLVEILAQSIEDPAGMVSQPFCVLFHLGFLT